MKNLIFWLRGNISNRLNRLRESDLDVGAWRVANIDIRGLRVVDLDVS